MSQSRANKSENALETKISKFLKCRLGLPGLAQEVTDLLELEKAQDQVKGKAQCHEKLSSVSLSACGGLGVKPNC